jgi:hypothetical protein
MLHAPQLTETVGGKTDRRRMECTRRGRMRVEEVLNDSQESAGTKTMRGFEMDSEQ